MSVQSQTEQLRCAGCGHTAAGRFCANCGASLAPRTASVLGLATSELLEVDERRSFLTECRKVLRRPVSAAVELALNPQWRGHAAFFFFAVAVTALQSRLPETSLPQWMQSSPPSADEGAFEKNFNSLFTNFTSDIEIVFMYAFFAATLWLSYRMFSKRATVARSAGDFIKVSCIALGFTAMLAFLPSIPQVLGALRIISVDRAAQSYTLLLLGSFLLSIAYIAMLNRAFWQVSAWRAAVLTSFISLIGVAAALVAILILLAGLAWAMTALGY